MASLIPTPEIKNFLTSLTYLTNMSLEEMAQCINAMNTTEREHIIEQHKAKHRITPPSKDNRWRTRLPDGRQIAKTKENDLYDAIVEYYTAHLEIAVGSCTLTTIYPKWLDLRRNEVQMATLSDDIHNWNTFLATTEIANTPLESLSSNDWKNWLNKLVKKHPMTRKYYNNIKSLVNSMLDFAVDEGYLDQNKFRGIRLKRRDLLQNTPKEDEEEVFTESEQALVISEAEKDSTDKHSALPLGIPLLFLTGMRIGELCALTYDSIQGDYLYVRRMLVEDHVETSDGIKGNGYQIVEHAKTSAGMRKIILTQDAKEYLRRIKELNELNGYGTSESDLIFQRKKGLCNQRVFDSRLRKYCRHLGFTFNKSCHDIRRTYISKLFDLGINPDTIRRLAGHENIEMTMKYCRKRKDDTEIAKILEQGLSA